MERKIWMILLVLLLGIVGFWLMPKTPKDNMEDIFLPQSIQAQTVAPTENSAISLPYAPERWELVAEGATLAHSNRGSARSAISPRGFL